MHFSLCEISIFGMRFAILNISSGLGSNDKIKNILMSDTGTFKIVYGQNSPTYFVNGKIILVESRINSDNILTETKQTNATTSKISTNNKGCNQYVNTNLPENYIAVIYFFVFTTLGYDKLNYL